MCEFQQLQKKKNKNMYFGIEEAISYEVKKKYIYDLNVEDDKENEDDDVEDDDDSNYNENDNESFTKSMTKNLKTWNLNTNAARSKARPNDLAE